MPKIAGDVRPVLMNVMLQCFYICAIYLYAMSIS